jgi:hypothetical protein
VRPTKSIALLFFLDIACKIMVAAAAPAGAGSASCRID